MTLPEAKILVVDDEPLLRMTFSVVLQRAGAEVHSAANGLEALGLLQGGLKPDVILSDKLMPEMDGMTMLRTLKEQGLSAPTLLFVNELAPEQDVEIRPLGVVGTISKPIHPQELIAALQRVLETLPSA